MSIKMINNDIVNYSKDFLFIESFLNELFEDIGLGRIEEGNSFIEFGNSLIADDFIQFRVSSKDSIELIFYITYDGLRVDILNLPEMIEYSLEDIKKDYNKIYNELKNILTLKCIVSNRCECYKFKFLDSNGDVRKKYTFANGLLAIFTFLPIFNLCMCPFARIETYPPIVET